MQTTHRSWVPFILVGLSAAILAAYIVWGVPSQMPDAAPSSAVSAEPGRVAPTEDEYKDEMQTVLSDYAGADDAGRIYERLLQVTVPPAFLEQHLQFVIAFGEIKAGNISAGEARLDVARTAAGI